MVPSFVLTEQATIYAVGGVQQESSEHFASNVRVSSAGPAKLDIIRGCQYAPPLRAEEAAARLEKCGQSMSTSV